MPKGTPNYKIENNQIVEVTEPVIDTSKPKVEVTYHCNRYPGLVVSIDPGGDVRNKYGVVIQKTAATYVRFQDNRYTTSDPDEIGVLDSTSLVYRIS